MLVLRADSLEGEAAARLGEALPRVDLLVALTDQEAQPTVGNDPSVEVPVAVPDVPDDPVPNMEVETRAEIGLILEVARQATRDQVSPDHAALVNNPTMSDLPKEKKNKAKEFKEYSVTNFL